MLLNHPLIKYVYIYIYVRFHAYMYMSTNKYIEMCVFSSV